MDELQAKALKEMHQLKQYFPYRIVWSVIYRDKNEVEAFATVTKHRLNSYVRKGLECYIYQ